MYVIPHFVKLNWGKVTVSLGLSLEQSWKKKKKKKKKKSNSGLLSIMLFYILKRQLVLLPMTLGLWLALQIFVHNSTV